MKTVDFTGSVSSGTMRGQDLLPAFLDVLEKFNPKVHDEIVYRIMYDQQFGDEWDLALTPQERAQQNYDQLCGDEDDIFWDSEDAGWALESAFDAMEEIAPEYHSFGSHPGDGADYGFWLWEECQMLLWDVGEFTQQADYDTFSPSWIVRTIAERLIVVMTAFSSREMGFRELVDARRTAKSLLNRLDDIQGG